MNVPDAIEPVVGYRAWAVGLGALWSPAAPVMERWPRDAPMRARCLARASSGALGAPTHDEPPHDAPDRGCRCGIHAAWEPWGIAAVSIRPPFVLVIGRVEGWGRVVVGTRGWRAAVARATELHTDPAWTDATRRTVHAVASAARLRVREVTARAVT